ncbi:MAG: DNA gyrase inhibitor YacG [Alteraurantiacibacter sp. bin_em_oilr2.035]|uniref:DNA gyrase inhibitor YacG n=1 Tax=Aurantiacibacter atlanticus TaxID=1648404 RepID=UPI00065F2755|nr:DNA gyrase inhibitor YacG [Aurantiacibacter atlanticus]MDF1834109.1 DNA gyrase inhibitor YacG [Alteraurantiacibacter sp. bin_em_oilr2.035]
MTNAAKARPCPICRKPRTQEFTPFCSSHCRDRDLAQWFNDGYALPGEAARPEDIAQED